MQDHISNTARGCFYHLRSLGKLRPFLSARAANAIIVSMVMSRLDYCNSCSCGIASQQLKRFQLVQNKAARIVTRTRKKEHVITPVLKELHWLPVRKRINHKIISYPEIMSQIASTTMPPVCFPRFIPLTPSSPHNPHE